MITELRLENWMSHEKTSLHLDALSVLVGTNASGKSDALDALLLLNRKMLGWQHCGGFSVRNQVRVGAGDREGRIKLACYMFRAPMSLEKMSYDAGTGTQSSTARRCTWD